MSLIPKSQIKNVKGISSEEMRDISIFFQNAINHWCENNKEKWFSLRDFVNSDWSGTPLFCLYSKHKTTKGKKHKLAIKNAGIDAGWILKKVLNDDKKRFVTKVKRFRQYKCIDSQISSMQNEIAEMQSELVKYEKKYNLETKDFYRDFELGKFGDEKDYMFWAGIYELQIDSKNKLEALL